MTPDIIREPAGTLVVPPSEAISHREADHRVANSLQLISSLLSLQARRSADECVREALGTAAHRVNAVGAIHKQLHQSGSRGSIDIARYLFDLAETIEQGFGGGIGRKRISAHVQGQMVSWDFASVLGILITELVINACKHAYAPDEQGDVEICLFFPSRTEFRMEVRDFGAKNREITAAKPSGLGTSIIQAMCLKLGADYARLADSEGTRCQIRGPVSS